MTLRLLGCFLAFLGLPLNAGTIKGVVVDNYTGRALARTAVTLSSLSPRAAAARANRTDRYGRFTFERLPAGAYLLSATRPAFVKLQYGQEAWNAPGKPLLVEDGHVITVQLRMRRLGAVSGMIWDENEIGLPEVEVLAYAASQPPKLVAKTKTDDRGVYRIGGLEPGSYFICTAARRLTKQTGLLPTFYKEVASVPAAREVTVALEEEATKINFRPLFGDVFRMSGEVLGHLRDVTVTLISEMGRRTQRISNSQQFTFDQLAPGTYELLTTGRDPRMDLADHREVLVERDGGHLRVHLSPLPRLTVHFEDEAGDDLEPENVRVLVRRKDLAGVGSAREIPTSGEELSPGGWEIRVASPAEYYPASITGRALADPSLSWAGGWREIRLHQAARVTLRVRLSSHPARLAGAVSQSREPVVGAPVYLEAVDRRGLGLGDVHTTRSDPDGLYRFSGLAPGKYWVLSSFESWVGGKSPATAAPGKYWVLSSFESWVGGKSPATAAPAKTLSLKEGSETRHDLELYVTR